MKKEKIIELLKANREKIYEECKDQYKNETIDSIIFPIYVQYLNFGKLPKCIKILLDEI